MIVFVLSRVERGRGLWRMTLDPAWRGACSPAYVTMLAPSEGSDPARGRARKNTFTNTSANENTNTNTPTDVCPPPSFGKLAVPRKNDRTTAKRLAKPPSFRVYTPEELKSVPLRPAHRRIPYRPLAEELRTELGSITLRSVVKWAGGILMITGALFAVLLGIANLTDDTVVRPSGHASEKVDRTRLKTGAASAVLASAVATDVVPATDFEVPDDAAPPPRMAVKAAPSPRSAKQAKHASVSIRNAPY